MWKKKISIIILECWLKFISQPDSSCSYSFGQPAKWKLASVIRSVRRSVPACCLSVCKSVSNSGGLSVRQRVHQSGSQSVSEKISQAGSQWLSESFSQSVFRSFSQSVGLTARPSARQWPALFWVTPGHTIQTLSQLCVQFVSRV